MTRETFNMGFTALVRAYAYVQEKLNAESQDIYWEILKDIPDEVFNQAVRKCLASCKFFPSMAEIGEAAYPTIEEPAPYNAFAYHEPRKIDWREQVRRHIERKAIEPRKGQLPRPKGWGL